MSVVSYNVGNYIYIDILFFFSSYLNQIPLARFSRKHESLWNSKKERKKTHTKQNNIPLWKFPLCKRFLSSWSSVPNTQAGQKDFLFCLLLSPWLCLGAVLSGANFRTSAKNLPVTATGNVSASPLKLRGPNDAIWQWWLSSLEANDSLRGFLCTLCYKCY